MPRKVTTPAVSNWGNFQSVSERVRYRLIWRSFGAEKTGKNHFGLTAPGPIAIQSFDVGLEGVVEKFFTTPLGPKVVKKTEYEFDKDDCTQSAAEDIRDKFVEDFEVALKIARTIVWDTETEIWEVFRYAQFNAMSDAPKNYVELNARYRDLIQRVYETDVSLQLIQKVKERWGTVQKVDRHGRSVSSPYPTGEMEPTGFKEAGYIVQANLKHSWNKEQGFLIEVLNCRQNMGIAGETFTDLSFPDLAQMVFPGSGSSDWS